MSNTALAFIMCSLAGISTGIGSVISLFAKRTDRRFLCFSLAFSAGVMLYASMNEIMKKSVDAFEAEFSPKSSALLSVACFFCGTGIIFLIGKLLPEEKSGLRRTGVCTAAALAIHNFPEGLATFVSALKNPVMAIPIAFAIALHNIPEGIAVSVPIYYSTGSKKRAFAVSFLSGLCEPVGALIGYVLLRKYMSDTVFGALFGLVAGIMTFISFTELLPSSAENGPKSLCHIGTFSGMAVMALSLCLFK
jgi:ZIP family zinc transporter